MATAPLTERLLFPQWDPAIITSGDDGWGNFHGLSFRIEKRHSSELFYTGSYEISRNIHTNSGEVETNQFAFAWDPYADKGYSRYHRRHRSLFGYELPFGAGTFTVTVEELQNLGRFVPSRADFAPGREG